MGWQSVETGRRYADTAVFHIDCVASSGKTMYCVTARDSGCGFIFDCPMVFQKAQRGSALMGEDNSSLQWSWATRPPRKVISAT